MPTPLVFPPSVAALGRETVLYLPTVADPKAVTIPETQVTGAVLMTCAMRGFNVTAEQSRTKKYRLCSKQGFDVLGRVDWTIERLVLINDPQAPPTSPLYPHKALVEGSKGFFLRRQGFDSGQGTFVDFAGGQLYDIFPITMGIDVPMPVAPEEDGQEFEYGQEVAITGPRQKGTLVAAAA